MVHAAQREAGSVTLGGTTKVSNLADAVHPKGRTYEEAMKAEGLQPATIAAVQDGYASIREGHDKMSALKHAQA